jgi:hypothetical protein
MDSFNTKNNTQETFQKRTHILNTLFTGVMKSYLVDFHGQDDYLQKVKDMKLIDPEISKEHHACCIGVLDEKFTKDRQQDTKEADHFILVATTSNPQLYLENIYSDESLQKIKLYRDLAYELLYLCRISNQHDDFVQSQQLIVDKLKQSQLDIFTTVEDQKNECIKRLYHILKFKEE